MPYTVSVILPTRNRAATLERAIRSVLAQTLADFELIIIDDRSTDDTNLVLERFYGQDNIRIVSQLRRGCAVARNIGVSVAEGRYLAFQESGDEWFPEALATAVHALERTGPETGVYYCDMLRVHAPGKFSRWIAPEVKQGVLIDEKTFDYQPLGIGIQSAVIKRACIGSVGDFDEALPRFIDLELFIRLSDRFRFVHCADMLVKYHAVEGISTDRAALVIARQHLLRKYRHRLVLDRRHLAQQHLHVALALEENSEHWRSLVAVLKALLISVRWPIRERALEIVDRRIRALARRPRRAITHPPRGRQSSSA